MGKWSSNMWQTKIKNSSKINKSKVSKQSHRHGRPAKGGGWWAIAVSIAVAADRRRASTSWWDPCGGCSSTATRPTSRLGSTTTRSSTSTTSATTTPLRNGRCQEYAHDDRKHNHNLHNALHLFFTTPTPFYYIRWQCKRYEKIKKKLLNSQYYKDSRCLSLLLSLFVGKKKKFRYICWSKQAWFYNFFIKKKRSQ